jgi:hypothetical protein
MKTQVKKRLLFVVLLVVSMGATLLPVSAQGAWTGEYFANRNLEGSPVLTRSDGEIRFDWGNGSPGSGIPGDNFSARWTRDEWFEAGTYRFSHRSDDGIRIWVGDTLVVDDWRDQEATWSFVDRYIPRGTHRVRVEYYEHTGGAAVQVVWERVGSSDVWRAEYYANGGLNGSPALVRYDQAIDFDWGSGSPAPQIPADNFSVRWTRTLGFLPGTYRLFASTDDGVRIFVDGNLVVDDWRDQELPNTNSGDITLSEGQHTVVVEYYEHGGEAAAHVWWERLGTFSGWRGRYYANPNLRGGPALIRDDAAINFDWGEGAPVDWMPNDNFSASWTRSVTFSPGLYRFNLRSDDGARVWLDNSLILDFWRPMDYELHYVDGIRLEGTHTIRVEYFEQAGNARIHFWWESGGATPAPGVPTPVPTPSGDLPGPWQGEYFANRGLEGSPVLTRQDAAISFNWGWDGPTTQVGEDNFSVRWTGTFPFEAGRYRFTTYSDDGIRLYVDDQLIVNSWRPMRGTRYGYATLTAGNHTVRVEYFEGTQAATARVDWQRIGTAPSPTATSTPGQTGAPGPWQAHYYANDNLTGEPVLTRQEDARLNYYWGWDSPAAALPADHFSAVWTREVQLDGGRYLFTTYSDDGVRLYVDGRLVIDSWRAMRGTRSGTVTLSPGTHTVRLEYFERTGIALVRLNWRLR